MSAQLDIDPQAGNAPHQVEVLITTIAFPLPSEAFAGVEVRALLAGGARVRVRALRFPHELTDVLLSDWSLDKLDVTQSSATSVVRGLAAMLLRPIDTIWVFAWLSKRAWRSPRLLLRCAALLPRVFDILRDCERKPPDVLHLFWGHYPAVLAALMKRRLPAVHVSMSLGAYDLLYRFGPSVDVANIADSLWTHAKCNVETIRSMGVSNPRLEVLPRGLDFKRVPPSVSVRFRGRIVTVARLEQNKGVDDVIRTFAVALAQLPHLSLVLIGEGPDRGRLDRLAGELGVRGHVRFMGATTHSAVLQELILAEVFILLSRNPTERLPNALKEAMACGCICVTTQTPGIEELQAHASNPLVVAQGSWMEAAQRLLGVLRAPESYVEARDAGRQFLIRDYDARALAARRIAVWTRQEASARFQAAGSKPCAD
jgi:glycosyltransferase involved in cell wall biosynthesis